MADNASATLSKLVAARVAANKRVADVEHRMRLAVVAATIAATPTLPTTSDSALVLPLEPFARAHATWLPEPGTMVAGG